MSAPAAALGLLAASMSHAGDIPFGDHTISDQAAGATGLVVVDIDGDGDLDLVSSSFNDDTIAWYENHGDRPLVFERHVITIAANGASSVAAGDLDGDGDTDIVFAAANDDSIGWLENSGGPTPSFAMHVVSASVERPRSVEIADVDDDGDLDVLSASSDDDTIAWYRNDLGDGSVFTEMVITDTADGAADVYVADLDDDEDLDVISAASFILDEVAWYENDGATTPSFTKHVITTDLSLAASVFAGDVDRDGDIDVLSASGFDDKIAWYENDGTETPQFTQRVVSTDAAFARAVFVADLNDDRYVDVLSASSSDGRIAWYENDTETPPKFTVHTVTTSALGANDVRSGDLDADGDIDLVSASGFDGRIVWYENRTPIPPDVCTADIDGGGTVGFDDLIALLADWGPCPGCPGNLDGTGTVDFSDLGVLLAGWGSCPSGGACCLPSGICLEGEEAECTVFGGTFMGSGTSCSTTSCP